MEVKPSGGGWLALTPLHYQRNGSMARSAAFSIQQNMMPSTRMRPRRKHVFGPPPHTCTRSGHRVASERRHGRPRARRGGER
eukprot:346518-Prymnesium_polylepis.1